jgi:hypothetical protein
MADIELVIKIPDHLYKLLKEFPSDSNESNIENVLMKAVGHGTPLPKGHGRLKDIDEIKWYVCTSEDDCPYKNRDCKDCDRAECSKTQFDNIPVLIPADKE